MLCGLIFLFFLGLCRLLVVIWLFRSMVGCLCCLVFWGCWCIICMGFMWCLRVGLISCCV